MLDLVQLLSAAQIEIHPTINDSKNEEAYHLIHYWEKASSISETSLH